MFGIYRLILSLFVVVGHLLGMRHSAGAAVFSFYMLSGFLMTHIMKERYGYGARSFRAFSYHRFLRLYPMYWIAMLIALVGVLALGSEFTVRVNEKIYLPSDLGSWLWNIIIISPSWNPIDIEPRFVSPAWALTVEIFYYIAIALGISRKRGLTWLWFIASLGYYIATFSLGYEFGWRAKSLLCASLPFSIGSLLYYYKESFSKLGAKKLGMKLGVIAAYSVISVASYVILDLTSPDSADALFAFSLIPSILALVVLYPPLTKSKPLLVNMDNFFGSLSYPYYVLHWPVSIWVIHCLNFDSDLGFTKSGIACFLVVLIVMTLIGFLFERFIEPRIRGLRKLYK